MPQLYFQQQINRNAKNFSPLWITSSTFCMPAGELANGCSLFPTPLFCLSGYIPACCALYIAYPVYLFSYAQTTNTHTHSHHTRHKTKTKQPNQLKPFSFINFNYKALLAFDFVVFMLFFIDYSQQQYNNTTLASHTNNDNNNNTINQIMYINVHTKRESFGQCWHWWRIEMNKFKLYCRVDTQQIQNVYLYKHAQRTQPTTFNNNTQPHTHPATVTRKLI